LQIPASFAKQVFLWQAAYGKKEKAGGATAIVKCCRGTLPCRFAPVFGYFDGYSTPKEQSFRPLFVRCHR
jgi:hypothetical protein